MEGSAKSANHEAWAQLGPEAWVTLPDPIPLLLVLGSSESALRSALARSKICAMDETATETPTDVPWLTPVEARVLGCLLEKEATTPDVYPLSLNSLQLACNQKTNRHPVVAYEESEVLEALDGLREKGWALRVDASGSRVKKFRHRVDERLGLDRAGKAILTVLLLRGPQTLGELRTRCERLYAFPSREAVEGAMQELEVDLEPPLCQTLPPAPGQKERRTMHLLCGASTLSDPLVEGTFTPSEPRSSQRLQALESRVEALESELTTLRSAFEAFCARFE